MSYVPVYFAVALQWCRLPNVTGTEYRMHANDLGNQCEQDVPNNSFYTYADIWLYITINNIISVQCSVVF